MHHTLVVDSEIRLREISLHDAESIFQIIDCERGYLGQWLPFVELTQDLTFTQQFIHNYLSDKDHDLICSILYKNKLVGLISMKDTDYDNRKTEIGYWISEKFQGKGIVTKSCNRFIQYAFENLHIHRIQIKAATDNIKSRTIPERLYFKLEGIERDGELHTRGFVDLAVYSLLRSEWLIHLKDRPKTITNH